MSASYIGILFSSTFCANLNFLSSSKAALNFLVQLHWISSFHVCMFAALKSGSKPGVSNGQIIHGTCIWPQTGTFTFYPPMSTRQPHRLETVIRLKCSQEPLVSSLPYYWIDWIVVYIMHMSCTDGVSHKDVLWNLGHTPRTITTSPPK